MGKRSLGMVLLVCGFFLSINEKLPMPLRFAGIVAALVGILLMVLGSKKGKPGAGKK